MRRSDPDWYPAMVMNPVLGGGGFAARLMKKTRSDEGLTYGVRTQLGEGPHWRGDLTGDSRRRTAPSPTPSAPPSPRCRG
jgi:predicted Zn-dependent peptidase